MAPIVEIRWGEFRGGRVNGYCNGCGRRHLIVVYETNGNPDPEFFQQDLTVGHVYVKSAPNTFTRTSKRKDATIVRGRVRARFNRVADALGLPPMPQAGDGGAHRGPRVAYGDVVVCPNTGMGNRITPPPVPNRLTPLAALWQPND